MRLEAGMKVPDFRLKAIDGQVYTKGDMLGKRYMLSFYRYASCPFCNLRVSFLRELSDSLGLNNQLLGVFQSTEEDMRNHVAGQDTNFPLFSDSNLSYYKKFGVEYSFMAYIKGALHSITLMKAYRKGFRIKKSMGPKTTVPADFLVDEHGIIVEAYYGKDIADHLELEKVSSFFKT